MLIWQVSVEGLALQTAEKTPSVPSWCRSESPRTIRMGKTRTYVCPNPPFSLHIVSQILYAHPSARSEASRSSPKEKGIRWPSRIRKNLLHSWRRDRLSTVWLVVKLCLDGWKMLASGEPNDLRVGNLGAGSGQQIRHNKFACP
jgi:hypothetical protein